MECRISEEEWWPVACVTFKEEWETDDPEWYCDEIPEGLYEEWIKAKDRVENLSKQILVLRKDRA